MTTNLSMRDAYGEALIALAEKHPQMVVLDADVASSTRTTVFAGKYPERFFNLGVAEANMVDVAAGMATCGLRPIVNTFAIFLALKTGDQISNVVCYNNLPVILAGAYGGLSDSYDGASHQSITDLAVMRAMPNLAVIVAGEASEVRPALEWALMRDGPTFIRTCRNATPALTEGENRDFDVTKIRRLREGNDLTIAVTGVPVFMAVQAADCLAAQGISAEVLEVPMIKPMDSEGLVASALKTGRVLTVEEHNIYGGFGAGVAEVLGRLAPVPVELIGIPDRFTESGDYMQLLSKYGVSTENIQQKALAMVKGIAS